MALLDFFNRNKKEATSNIVATLPKDIYAQGELELADMIAPAALKVGARELELGEKFARTFYTITYPRFLANS